MSNQEASDTDNTFQAMTARPVLGIEALNEQAVNLHWSWKHLADPLWDALDSYLQRANGEWLRIQIQVPGAKIWLRYWQVLVGRARLFLPDANDFADTAAHRLYALPEQEVVPQFYECDTHGLPLRWLTRVRESMATLTAEFSASRAIREYTNDQYLPAAAGYVARADKTESSDSTCCSGSVVSTRSGECFVSARFLLKQRVANIAFKSNSTQVASILTILEWGCTPTVTRRVIREPKSWLPARLRRIRGA